LQYLWYKSKTIPTMRIRCVRLSSIAQDSSLLPPNQSLIRIFNISAAVHTFISAMDLSLGRPLPCQLTNPEAANQKTIKSLEIKRKIILVKAIYWFTFSNTILLTLFHMEYFLGYSPSFGMFRFNFRQYAMNKSLDLHVFCIRSASLLSVQISYTIILFRNRT
jgi:hypothetical protein